MEGLADIQGNQFSAKAENKFFVVVFVVKISGRRCPGQTKEERAVARHGENIRKRKDGRWEARYQIFDVSKGRKVYRSVYGSTYEEAKKKQTDVILAAEKKSDYGAEQSNQGGDSSCIQVLFSQAAAEWLEEISGKRKYSTYVKYGNIYRIHIEGVLGSFLLSGILDQKIPEKISDHLSEKNLSDSIRKSVGSVAKQILEFAGRKYSVPVPVLALPAGKPGKRPVEMFSKSEQSRLLTCIYNNPDKIKTAMLLCLYTGMRLGELCALRWTDIDFCDRTVTINRTVQRITVKGCPTKTILMESDPKSESSKRTIPLTEEIIKWLKGLKEDGRYVFGGHKPFEPRRMQYQMKRILKEADVDNRNFHILRHTFATNCVESGMDVKTLSMILGHSDVKITLNRYVHPTMDSRRAQIGRLPDFYGQIRGQAA